MFIIVLIMLKAPGRWLVKNTRNWASIPFVYHINNKLACVIIMSGRNNNYIIGYPAP